MGLVFLSVATAMPDIISSILVIRQFKGDMIVSSSIGSNLFDATVGYGFSYFFKYNKRIYLYNIDLDRFLILLIL